MRRRRRSSPGCGKELAQREHTLEAPVGVRRVMAYIASFSPSARSRALLPAQPPPSCLAHRHELGRHQPPAVSGSKRAGAGFAPRLERIRRECRPRRQARAPERIGAVAGVMRSISSAACAGDIASSTRTAGRHRGTRGRPPRDPPAAPPAAPDPLVRQRLGDVGEIADASPRSRRPRRPATPRASRGDREPGAPRSGAPGGCDDVMGRSVHRVEPRRRGCAFLPDRAPQRAFAWVGWAGARQVTRRHSAVQAIIGQRAVTSGTAPQPLHEHLPSHENLRDGSG